MQTPTHARRLTDIFKTMTFPFIRSAAVADLMNGNAFGAGSWNKRQGQTFFKRYGSALDVDWPTNPYRKHA
jgi:hypothetical protein